MFVGTTYNSYSLLLCFLRQMVCVIIFLPNKIYSVSQRSSTQIWSLRLWNRSCTNRSADSTLIHSFILLYSSQGIDPEFMPVTGIYSPLQGTMHTHLHTYSHLMAIGGGRKPGKVEKADMVLGEPVQKLHTDSNPSSGSNQGSRSFEAVTLPATSLCYNAAFKTSCQTCCIAKLSIFRLLTYQKRKKS